MRIERLDLAPYGRFTDRALRFSPDAALHVVLGANEAGKSTTLSAIGDLLYGFGVKTKYGFLHDQQLLRVGGVLRLADGSRLEARRRKGNKQTLRDAADRPISDEPLRQTLIGVDRAAFESEFGLTATQLRSGGKALLDAGGKLAESLAAGSASLSALSALQRQLAEDANELFSERRVAGKDFYVALDRHDAAAKALKAAIVDRDEMSAAQAALDEAKLRALDLQDRHKALSVAINRRKRAQRVAGKLRALSEVAGRLTALAGWPAVPASFLAEARAAFVADVRKREELERLEAEDAQAAREMAALPVDETLTATGARVEALNQQLGAASERERDLPHRLSDQEDARLQLDKIAARLGLPGHAELLASTPTDPQLAHAKTLVEARRRERQRRQEATAGRQAALDERARLDAARPVSASDPAPLKRRLDALESARKDAQELRRERGQIELEARKLAEEAAALDPPVTDLDALARLPLPEEADLLQRAKAEQAAEEALRSAALAFEEARREVATRESALSKLEGAAGGATRADWDAARAGREAALDRLGAALDGPAEAREERFAAARALTLAADRTVESVLSDAARAARLQAAHEELAARRAEAAARERRLSDATAFRQSELEASQKLWRHSGLALEGSAKMARWRRLVGALLARRVELDQRRSSLAALAETVGAARRTLTLWLTERGVPVGADDFEEALRAARVQLDELSAAWLASREVEIGRLEADKTIAKYERTLAEARDAEAGLVAAWPDAAVRLRLRAEATLEEADAALSAWADVDLPRFKLHAATDRIAKIRERDTQFERDVEAVVDVAAPALVGTPALQAVLRLTAALTVARKAADDLERRRREAAARAARRIELERERAGPQQILARMSELLGATAQADLASALEALEAREKLEQEQIAFRRDLAEIGEGLDELQLRAEQSEFELAGLQAEIIVAEQEQARRLDDIREAAAAEGDAHRRLDALEKGRDAAGAARDRTEAAGELLDIAERWLVRAAAARLANRAIERHRAAAQDPLIESAGRLFAVATAGSFAGLGVSYDEGDNPLLVARRAEGKSVSPDGLSEGARDQLFLSLRLALLERRAGEPLPFIGDDLLASFDDERARRTLDLLAEFGARRQTILFTHHAQIAELARSLTERAIEVIEL